MFRMEADSFSSIADRIERVISIVNFSPLKKDESF